MSNGSNGGSSGSPGADINDFLNPNSMMTPGFAGATTMMLSNVLAGAFNLHVAGTGLVISAVFGLLVVGGDAPALKKLAYYILNSLIIFCVAMGSGNAAWNIATGRAQVDGLHAPPMATAALAQPNTPQTKADTLRDVETINKDPNLTAEQKLEQIRKLLDSAKTRQEKPAEQRFFKKWEF